jgi:nickel-dependent lactate racemase
MQKVDAPFDIVVTTNSGYPLDQNLYQGVKGMSAAARILKPGGTLILACECRDGIPAHSSYERILSRASTVEEMLGRLAAPGTYLPDQWQAQIQGLIQRRAQVFLYSSLAEATVRGAHLVPCHDIGAKVKQLLQDKVNGQHVGVLPQGPLTIPYLA